MTLMALRPAFVARISYRIVVRGRGVVPLSSTDHGAMVAETGSDAFRREALEV